MPALSAGDSGKTISTCRPRWAHTEFKTQNSAEKFVADLASTANVHADPMAAEEIAVAETHRPCFLFRLNESNLVQCDV